jgi:hypothetical protein
MYFIPSSVAAALAATFIALVLQSPAIAQTKDAEPASRAVNGSFSKPYLSMTGPISMMLTGAS